MALIGHWKLNGNALDSSGYSQHGVVGTGNYIAGKLGQAFDHSTSTAINAYLNRSINKDCFSISYWGRGTAIPPGDWRRHIELFDEDNSRFFYTDTRQTTNTYILFIIKDYVLSSWNVKAVISSAEYQNWKWNHYVCVYRGTSFDSCRNGEYLGTVNITVDTDPYKNINRLQINGVWDNFETDDVRLYDHWLSIKEIKELAKAKVLHFGFDDFQEPTENLIPYGDNLISNLITTDRGVNFDDRVTTFVENGITCYNVHYERIAGSGNSWASVRSQITTPNTPGDYSLSLYLRINSSSGAIGQVRLSAVINDYWTADRKTWSLNAAWDIWHKIELSTTFVSEYILSSVVYPLNVHIEIYTGNQNAVGNLVDYDFKLVQIEAKDHVTPFIAGSREGTVIDHSGQDNHAPLVLATTPKWVAV